jgi:hypothetical protein
MPGVRATIGKFISVTVVAHVDLYLHIKTTELRENLCLFFTNDEKILKLSYKNLEYPYPINY